MYSRGSPNSANSFILSALSSQEEAPAEGEDPVDADDEDEGVDDEDEGIGVAAFVVVVKATGGGAGGAVEDGVSGALSAALLTFHSPNGGN